MSITVQIDDYLEEDEIKAIITEELRMAFREAGRSTVGNYVEKIITTNLVLDAADKDTIRHKVKDATERISSYEIFREGSAGRKAIEEVVEENVDAIKEKVLKSIEKYTGGQIEDALQSFVVERIRAAFSNRT